MFKKHRILVFCLSLLVPVLGLEMTVFGQDGDNEATKDKGKLCREFGYTLKVDIDRSSGFEWEVYDPANDAHKDLPQIWAELGVVVDNPGVDPTATKCPSPGGELNENDPYLGIGNPTYTKNACQTSLNRLSNSCKAVRNDLNKDREATRKDWLDNAQKSRIDALYQQHLEPGALLSLEPKFTGDVDFTDLQKFPSLNVTDDQEKDFNRQRSEIVKEIKDIRTEQEDKKNAARKEAVEFILRHVRYVQRAARPNQTTAQVFGEYEDKSISSEQNDKFRNGLGLIDSAERESWESTCHYQGKEELPAENESDSNEDSQQDTCGDPIEGDSKIGSEIDENLKEIRSKTDFIEDRIRELTLSLFITGSNGFEVSRLLTSTSNQNQRSQEGSLTIIKSEDTEFLCSTLDRNSQEWQDTCGNNLFDKVIRLASQIVGTIGVILLLIAAIMLMTARGDESQTSKGKMMIGYTLGGLLVFFLSFIIVQFIIDLLVW